MLRTLALFRLSSPGVSLGPRGSAAFKPTDEMQKNALDESRPASRNKKKKKKKKNDEEKKKIEK